MSPNASTWRYLGLENFEVPSCCHFTASVHPAPPEDCVEDMADYEQADGGDEEVVEVESLKAIHEIMRREQVRNYLIGCIGLLYNETVKVMENGSDV